MNSLLPIIVEKLNTLGAICENVLGTEIVKITYNGQSNYLIDLEPPYIPLGYKNIFLDYYFTKQFFLTKGFPVLPGVLFHQDDLERALAYAQHELTWPVVIKSALQLSNKRVFRAINSRNDFIQIWQQHIKYHPQSHVVIEPYWSHCPDYCFMKFNDSVPAAVVKRSPSATDEASVVSETIQNQCVHPSYWVLLDSIWMLFPQLPYISADVLVRDITQPATPENAALKSVNLTSNLNQFVAPDKGLGIDVLIPVMKALFPELIRNDPRII